MIPSQESYVCGDSFTPRDFQVVLYEAAKVDNVVCCLPQSAGKTFIAVTLVREKSREVCRKLAQGGKRAVFVSRRRKHAEEQAAFLRHHTVFKVGTYYNKTLVETWDAARWLSELEENNALVMTYAVFALLLSNDILGLLSIVVFDDCHLAVTDEVVGGTIRAVTVSTGKSPRVLGLTTSIVDDKCQPSQLGAVINKLEASFNCTVRSTNGILSWLQHAIQPSELVCETATIGEKNQLESRILERVQCLKRFLNDHRYDPSEYYGEEDYLKEIPDPCEEPLQILTDFEEILNNFGIWGADRAALVYLVHLEKQKARAVYERHYLLLCLLVTFMTEVRVVCEEVMYRCSDYDRVSRFTRPKILRLFEILRLYKPPVVPKAEEPTSQADDNQLMSIDGEAVASSVKDAEPEGKTGEILTRATEDPATSVENDPPLNLGVDATGGQSTSIDGSPQSKEVSPEQPASQSTSADARRPHIPRRRREGIIRAARNADEAHQFSCIIFVHKKTTAKILYHLLKDAARSDPDLSYVCPLYTVSSSSTTDSSSKELLTEERKQEEVLTRFRTKESNILIATSVLESGIELPGCRLVVRFDWPASYKSYVHSKARARVRRSHFVLLLEEDRKEALMDQLTQFHAVEQLLLNKTGYISSVDEATYSLDILNSLFPPYAPREANGHRVSLLSAIVTVNRYCSKLPSDTFTRLVPIWSVKTLSWSSLDKQTQETLSIMQKSRNTPDYEDIDYYQCSLMLPINSPLRETVLGHVMPTKNLAKRSAALEICKKLHQSNELDDNLLPLTKENFKQKEEFVDEEEEVVSECSGNLAEGVPRPGTTKRRQYYYKEIASSFKDCYPNPGTPCYLYAISMVLTEPIPDEQNTRGRKIFRPESTSQSLGFVTAKPLPQVCPFPIFTRSGEVEVTIQAVQYLVFLTAHQLERLALFQRYLFRNVLSLEKEPMIFDVLQADCSYLVVPLLKKDGRLTLDHDFAELIAGVLNSKPRFHSDDERKSFTFDPRRFQDTVVMRWYRDQERPQCFYVAEIFYELNPQSKFPDNNYPTFEKYYREKYGITIQNLKQPLLDVDHTSARLNLLTPRYVNRKGVMLPTSSKPPWKVQRDIYLQKQILVPELCSIHPIPASLWRQIVCFPCILYRLNGLLLADSLRRTVSSEIKLGMQDLPTDFQWPPLRFGWKKKAVLPAVTDSSADAVPAKESSETVSAESDQNPPKENTGKESKKGARKGGGPMMDIGVWNPNSLDAKEVNQEEEYDVNDLRNITLLNNPDMDFDNAWTSSFCEIPEKMEDHLMSWEDPAMHHLRPRSPSQYVDCYSDGYNSDADSYPASVVGDSDSSDDDEEDDSDGYKPKEFGPKLLCKGDTAEAIEETKPKAREETPAEETDDAEEETEDTDLVSQDWALQIETEESDVYKELLRNHKELLLNENFVGKDDPVPITPVFAAAKSERMDRTEEKKKEELSLAAKERRRKISSESRFTLELTRLLLGNGSKDSGAKAGFQTAEDWSDYADVDPDPWEVAEMQLDFSFDGQPDLSTHSGPSPSVILQAFTMSSANDGINLERLETIGDSFLKYAVTTYLYCRYTNIHEGKLSYLRSRQVSNFHLYHLGKKKQLGGYMIATKFNPHDNWLPPGYVIPESLEEALIASGVPLNYWNVAELQGLDQLNSDQVRAVVKEKSDQILARFGGQIPVADDVELNNTILLAQDLPRFVPYNLLTQQSIPDKSIADCVEALIGAYLTACGPRGALLFMSWLGLKVLPQEKDGEYGFWIPPPTPPKPVDVTSPEVLGSLEGMLAGYEGFEKKINYRFRNRFYLLQAFSHASYYSNRLTDCYQRLEFLGDAVLDYLITRYLYEDPRQHPPGALTDLRSALVNNTTFAVLAVRYDFHRYFRHYSHSLNQVMEKFIRAQEENGHRINEEYFLIEEDECEEAEDVEVPKALGDVFESVAGAIYLDSGMSLDAVWKVYYRMMKNEIDEFTDNVPKSPIRELLELETDRVKFGKGERLPDGRIRVTVQVIGKGTFKGIGRNYRIAKCTAAKFALRTLERRKMLAKRGDE